MALDLAGQILANEVASKPGIVGAIVVAFDEHGRLLIGACYIPHEQVAKVMGPIAGVISEHIRATFPDKDSSAQTGIFAAPDSLS